MLRGIDPLLGPDLLFVLRAMGHGDEIAVVDANYPATDGAKRLIRAEGTDAVRMVEAILTLMPLDTFVEMPAFRMEVVDDPQSVPPVCRAFDQLVARQAGGHRVGDARAVGILRPRQRLLRHCRNRRAAALWQPHPEERGHTAAGAVTMTAAPAGQASLARASRVIYDAAAPLPRARPCKTISSTFAPVSLKVSPQ